jgi:hypothetical protein
LIKNKYLLFFDKYSLRLFCVINQIIEIMKIGTTQILKVLHILAWIIFVGLCIQAGGFIVTAVFTLAKPTIVDRLWQQVDLTALFQYDHGHFFVEILLLSIVAVAKAWLFYLIVKLLYDKKLNLEQPFNNGVRDFIFKIAYAAFLIGVFSLWGLNYAEWLINKGVHIADLTALGGGDAWLFMSVALFVIAQIFKKGIEIQTENELTI